MAIRSDATYELGLAGSHILDEIGRFVHPSDGRDKEWENRYLASVGGDVAASWGRLFCLDWKLQPIGELVGLRTFSFEILVPYPEQGNA